MWWRWFTSWIRSPGSTLITYPAAQFTKLLTQYIPVPLHIRQVLLLTRERFIETCDSVFLERNLGLQFQNLRAQCCHFLLIIHD